MSKNQRQTPQIDLMEDDHTSESSNPTLLGKPKYDGEDVASSQLPLDQRRQHQDTTDFSKT